jgi:hypothetical protein
MVIKIFYLSLVFLKLRHINSWQVGIAPIKDSRKIVDPEVVMNEYQESAYLEGALIDYAMRITFATRDAYKNHVPKELLHKFLYEMTVKAYGRAFDTSDQAALKAIPDMNHWQAKAYLEGASLDYAIEVDRYEKRSAYGSHVPKELLRQFHSEIQVKAYGKAFKASDQEALDTIPYLNDYLASAYLDGAPLDYAIRITSATRDAYKNHVPKELLRKFYSEIQVKAYGKAFDASDQAALAAIPDMKDYQASAYLEGAPLDYAIRITSATRDAYKNHVPKELLHKFLYEIQVKAYGKAFKASDQAALDTILDMSAWQAKAYLEGAPLDYAMLCNMHTQREAYNNNIPKDLLHKFSFWNQVNAYGKAFKASDQAALEAIPDMNKHQAWLYLEGYSLYCAKKAVSYDEQDSLPDKCLENPQYIGYEIFGEYIEYRYREGTLPLELISTTIVVIFMVIFTKSVGQITPLELSELAETIGDFIGFGGDEAPDLLVPALAENIYVIEPLDSAAFDGEVVESLGSQAFNVHAVTLKYSEATAILVGEVQSSSSVVEG